MRSHEGMRAVAITMSGVHDPIDRALSRVLTWVDRAAKIGASIVFFPELILGHYHEVPVAVDGLEVRAVSKRAQESGVAVGLGIGEKDGSNLYSAYVLCGAEGSVSVHRKTRWQTARCPISLGSVTTAHDFGCLKIGVMICSETRFPEVAQSLAAEGAELLIMPHAYGVGGPNWQPLQTAIENTVTARCLETSLSAIVVAATGEGFQGGCALVSAQGKVLYHEIDDHERAHKFRIRSAQRNISLDAIAEQQDAPDL